MPGRRLLSPPLLAGLAALMLSTGGGPSRHHSAVLVAAALDYGPREASDCQNGGTWRRRPGDELSGGYYCDCSTAYETSAFAGHMCEHSATRYCQHGVAVSTVSFCVNGGQCKQVISSASQGHQGCWCDYDKFEGDHCEYSIGEKPPTRTAYQTGMNGLSNANGSADGTKIPGLAIAFIVAAVLVVMVFVGFVARRTYRRSRMGGVEIVTFPSEVGNLEADGGTMVGVSPVLSPPGSFPGGSDIGTSTSTPKSFLGSVGSGSGGRKKPANGSPTDWGELDADGSSTLKETGVLHGTFPTDEEDGLPPGSAAAAATSPTASDGGGAYFSDGAGAGAGGGTPPPPQPPTVNLSPARSGGAPTPPQLNSAFPDSSAFPVDVEGGGAATATGARGSTASPTFPDGTFTVLSADEDDAAGGRDDAGRKGGSGGGELI